MSTPALKSVWNGLLAYNLTAANKRWLAEQLWKQAEREEAAELRPYTIAEIDAMLDASEADFIAGRCKTNDKVFQHV